MYSFLPDIYQKSVYAIDYISLKNAGIKVIIFDLDNTIVPISATSPSKKVKDLFEEVKKLGIKPIIMSNSGKNRVEPFKEELYVDAAYHSMKPLKRKYKRVLNIYNVHPNEVACIGDQLVTDIYGANKMGFTSILVNPISTQDFKWTKLNRFIERIIINHFKKRSVFEKGKYYE